MIFQGNGDTFIERHDQPHHGWSRAVECIDKGRLVDQATHDSIVIACKRSELVFTPWLDAIPMIMNENEVTATIAVSKPLPDSCAIFELACIC